jgi:hypothetical protein
VLTPNYRDIAARGLLKPAGYNPYPSIRARYSGYLYPCSGIGGYTSMGMRWAGQHFFEKKPVVPVPAYSPGKTRVPATRTRTHLSVPAYPLICAPPNISKLKKFPLKPVNPFILNAWNPSTCLIIFYCFKLIN